MRSNTEWKQWGKEDPLWGVASWTGKQKGAASAWTDEEFYALGEADWQEFTRHWRQYGVSRDSCLEVGCGAGRITRQLALSFDRVYAVDISEDMINYARQRIDAEHVEFSVIDGLHLPQPNCSVKAIFSTHVLQHLDSVELGFSYFREFYRVLDFGGTIMIHLPLYQWPTAAKGETLFQTLYASLKHVDNVRAEIRRRQGVKMMRRTPYPLKPLYYFLVDLGFTDLQIRIFPTISNGEPHSFVLATK